MNTSYHTEATVQEGMALTWVRMLAEDGLKEEMGIKEVCRRAEKVL